SCLRVRVPDVPFPFGQVAPCHLGFRCRLCDRPCPPQPRDPHARHSFHLLSPSYGFTTGVSSGSLGASLHSLARASLDWYDGAGRYGPPGSRRAGTFATFLASCRSPAPPFLAERRLAILAWLLVFR